MKPTKKSSNSICSCKLMKCVAMHQRPVSEQRRLLLKALLHRASGLPTEKLFEYRVKK
jgi:hypothetical protein